MSSGLANFPGTTGSTNLTVTRPGGSATVPVVVSVMMPTLPATTPSVVTVPTVTGTTWTCNTTSDLTAALAGCALGDEIVLTAGNTFAGTFTLRNITTGSGWVLIRTSASASLPARGTRVQPCDAINMPVITCPAGAEHGAGQGQAIQTAASAHHYWIVGVEITNDPSAVFSYGAVLLGDGSTAQNSLSLVPDHLVIDRCYIHGSPTFDCSRGVALNCGWAAVVDSYISEWHDAAGGSDRRDTQAICGWNGSGPYLIQNSHIEAAGENFMIGGSDPSITNQIPSDITIRNNWFFKPPAWNGVYEIKSILELKDAVRSQLDGNIFENCWQDAQDGTAIEFKTVNQGGTAPWSQTADVTFTNNIVRNCCHGINCAANPEVYLGHGGLDAARIKISNNLFFKIGDGDYAGGRIFIMTGIQGITYSLNTALGSAFSLYLSGTSPTINQIVIENNVFNGYGISSADGYGVGTAAMLVYSSPGWVLRNNVLVGQSSGGYPAPNYFPADMATLNLNTDYSLPTGSAYLTASSTGGAIGADISAIATATAGVDATNKARVTFVHAFDSTNATGTGAYSAPSFNAVAHNTIVVAVKALAASAFTPVITDTAGNTYGIVKKDYISGGNGIAFYKCDNCLGNASNVVQFADTGSTFKAIAVAQYSGCWRKLSSLDFTDGGHGTASGTYTTPAVSSGAANEVFVLIATDSLGGTLTIPGSWTTQTTSGLVFADRLVRSTYNETHTITSSNGSDVVQALVAAFK